SVQARFLGDWRPPARETVVRHMYDYARRGEAAGVRLQHVTRHMLGLYHGIPGARAWRRFLAEWSCRQDARAELLMESLALVGAAATPHAAGHNLTRKAQCH